MEIWERPPPPRQNRHHNTPSFSSSLLDAIYRSIDDSDTDTSGGEPQHRRRHFAGGPPDPIPPAAIRRKHCTSTSSSSSSSYFSSDADTPILIKPIRTAPTLTRPNPIRYNTPEERPNQNYDSRNKNLTSIKNKLREFRRSAGPASPGAKLAGFLNSIFHPATGRNPKKPKIAKEPSPCSSASSYSRSCLSKTPSTRSSTGGKRSVRFCPVGVIVGEDCRPCGEKIVFSSAAAAGGGNFPAAVREDLLLMKSFEMEDYESDSSEDLFELEINLGGKGPCDSNGKYRDELPVYETTNLGKNRAIARGLVV